MVERGQLLAAQPTHQSGEKQQQIPGQYAGENALLISALPQHQQHGEAERRDQAIEAAAATDEQYAATGQQQAGENDEAGTVGGRQGIEIEQHPHAPDDGGAGHADEDFVLHPLVQHQVKMALPPLDVAPAQREHDQVTKKPQQGMLGGDVRVEHQPPTQCDQQQERNAEQDMLTELGRHGLPDLFGYIRCHRARSLYKKATV